MRKTLLLFFVHLSIIVFAQAPSDYYKDAEGKSKGELKTALHDIIRKHNYLEYNSSTSIWWYTYFKTTDWHPDGYFWDMYSTDRYASYDGRIQNREHCMPRSWWQLNGDYGDANGDLHNLQPSNATANSAKSNYPPGEVDDIIFTNGVIKTGEGPTYSPSYRGALFEPADEYKGDFARIYMYMVTCYEDFRSRWTSLGVRTMLTKTAYPTFSSNAAELLLKWHRNDPVSTKETDRNDAVYGIQGNRNPFVDNPELAEYIWGNKTNGKWGIQGVFYEDFAISVNKEGTRLTVHAAASDGDMLTYQIFSIEGSLVDSQKINAYHNAIDISSLNNGMYILAVYLNNYRYTAKFYKNRF
ncbi:MAG: endonuclease [Prevotellaceae bacterium]|nr:endonuclease [Prevotellaceae bacterium]